MPIRKDHRMIISASYKTDIPAFFARQFLAEYQAGRFGNGYVLQPDDAFLFWTRNPGPFVQVLAQIKHPWTMTFTITGYPRLLEPRVPQVQTAVRLFLQLAAQYPGRLVWRYDPIVLGTVRTINERLDVPYHYAHFARLADVLAGATDEVTTSFLQPTPKRGSRVIENLSPVLKAYNAPITHQLQQSILTELQGIGRSRGMRLTHCGHHATFDGIDDGACADPQRLARQGWRPAPVQSANSFRRCGCAPVVDIGSYESCAHGCAYCYAVKDHATVLAWRRTDAGKIQEGKVVETT